jgi:hypothetical protein
METKKQKNGYFRSDCGKVHLVLMVLFLLSLAFSIYYKKTDDYMRFRDVKVAVIGHQINRGHLYLIVRNKDWGVFDIPASPTTYNTLRDGDQTYFSLREFDIRQTSQKNLKDFFFGCLPWCFTIALFIMSLFLPLLWLFLFEDSGFGFSPQMLMFWSWPVYSH